MLIPIYNNYPFAVVTDKVSFLKENTKEIRIVKALDQVARVVFRIPSDRVIIYAAEGARIYKLVFLSPDPDKIPFGQAYYIPQEKRIDIYDGGNLLLQSIGKNIMYKGYSMFMDRLEIDKLMSRFLSTVSS